jgi:hypothetical protein
MVEPTILCEEIWALLSQTIDEVISKCDPQIISFMVDNEFVGKPQ